MVYLNISDYGRPKIVIRYKKQMWSNLILAITNYTSKYVYVLVKNKHMPI